MSPTRFLTTIITILFALTSSVFALPTPSTSALYNTQQNELLQAGPEQFTSLRLAHAIRDLRPLHQLHTTVDATPFTQKCTQSTCVRQQSLPFSFSLSSSFAALKPALSRLYNHITDLGAILPSSNLSMSKALWLFGDLDLIFVGFIALQKLIGTLKSRRGVQGWVEPCPDTKLDVIDIEAQSFAHE